MEIDYNEVLGLPKTCNKKEIVQAYLKTLRVSCSPEQRKLFDRALVVLRIGYLTYVYQKRGEAGLGERRSSSLIERCIAAVENALSKEKHEYEEMSMTLDESITSWNDDISIPSNFSMDSFFDDLNSSTDTASSLPNFSDVNDDGDIPSSCSE